MKSQIPQTTLSKRAGYSLGMVLCLVGCGGGGTGSTQSSGSAPVVIPSQAVESAAPVVPTVPAALDATTLSPDASAVQISGEGNMQARSEPFLAGVATHFALPVSRGYEQAQVDSGLASAGFNSMRDDIYWNAFAPSWDRFGSHLESRLSDFVKATPARPMLILNNGNPYIAGTTPPVTDQARQHFADFAVRAVKAVNRADAIYEIWNEYNMRATTDEALAKASVPGAGDGIDTRSASFYSALADKAVTAIKAYSANTKVVVGAPADDPGWVWSRAVIGSGIMRKADGFSAHIYNHCNTTLFKGSTPAIGKLESLQATATAANGGTAVPLYITEFGWPTGGECATDPTAAADFTAHFLLYSAAKPWVKGVWIYELRDPTTERSATEASFGIYDVNFAEKPAVCRIRETTALIRQAQSMTVDAAISDVYIVRIHTATGMKAAVWTSRDDIAARVTIGGSAPFTARRMCDSANATANGRSVTFGRTPTIIDLPGVAQAAFQLKRS